MQFEALGKDLRISESGHSAPVSDPPKAPGPPDSEAEGSLARLEEYNCTSHVCVPAPCGVVWHSRGARYAGIWGLIKRS